MFLGLFTNTADFLARKESFCATAANELHFQLQNVLSLKKKIFFFFFANFPLTFKKSYFIFGCAVSSLLHGLSL